jgi:hypothetical protein
MQGIYTYIPETNHVSREEGVGGNENIRIMEEEKVENKQGIPMGWITSVYSQNLLIDEVFKMLKTCFTGRERGRF